MSDKIFGYDVYREELNSGKTSLDYEHWLKEKHKQQTGVFIILLVATTFFLYWSLRLQALFYNIFYRIIKRPLNQEIGYVKALIGFTLAGLVLLTILYGISMPRYLRILSTVSLALIGNWFFFSLVMRITTPFLPLFYFWKKT